MTKSKKEDRSQPSTTGIGPRKSQNYFWILMIVGILISFWVFRGISDISEIPYSVFETQLENKNIQNIDIRDDSAIGFFKIQPPKETTYDFKGVPKKPKPTADGKPETYTKQFYVQLPTDTQSRSKLIEKMRALKAADTELAYNVIAGSITDQIYWFIYIALAAATLFLLWTMLRRSRDQMMGGGFLSSFARSTAKRYEHADQPITFDDVAGLVSSPSCT